MMEIWTLIYLIVGLPFAYLWTKERWEKRGWYSGNHFWFSYILIFWFACLLWPLWLLVKAGKKALEKRKSKIEDK